MVVGAVPRLIVAGPSLYRDELSTAFVASDGLGDLLTLLADKVEITPPLSFVLAWIGPNGAGLRIPALLAGLAAIPLTYGLGARSVGSRQGLLAAALMTVAPFAVLYSGTARAYSLLIALSALTALAALLAIDTGRRRWWVVYGLATAATAYTHYTGVFVLAVLYAWIVLVHAEHRRDATLAVAGAVVLFLPWLLTGFRHDLSAPDAKLAAALVEWSPTGVLRSLGHWTLINPDGARSLWDQAAVTIVLVAVGLALALPAALRRRPGSRTLLMILLALAAPVGEIAASAVGPPSLTANSLASSFPALTVAVAALLLAPRAKWLRAAAAGCVLAGLLVGTVITASPGQAQPEYGPAATLIEQRFRPGDVVIDATGGFFSTPGPLTPLEPELDAPYGIRRLDVPQEFDHRFTAADVVVPPEQVVAEAVQDAEAGERIIVAAFSPDFFGAPEDVVVRLRRLGLPDRLRVVYRRSISGRDGVAEAVLFSQSSRR